MSVESIENWAREKGIWGSRLSSKALEMKRNLPGEDRSQQMCVGSEVTWWELVSFSHVDLGKQIQSVKHVSFACLT